MHIVTFSSYDLPVTDAQLGSAQHHISRIRAGDVALLDPVAERQPDVLVIAGFPADDNLADRLAAFLAAAPRCAVIPVLQDPPSSFLLRLMKIGVREVLAVDSPASIVDALGRVASRDSLVVQESAAGKRKRGRCTAFVSAKGGDGSTCIVANLASALSRYPDLRVIALDLSLPFGDLEMFMTSEPCRHDLADFSDEIERLDGSLLESMAQHLNGSLRLIPSPPSFEKFVHVSPTHVSRLLDIAAQNYDFVLVDLGAGLDPVGLSAVEKIDQLVVVATLTVPSLRRSGQILRLWEGLGYPMGRVSVIINRSGAHAELTVGQFEKAVGKGILREIPDEPEGVSESLLHGKPTVDVAPKSTFTRLMRDWAAECAGRPVEEKSLWQRLKIR